MASRTYIPSVLTFAKFFKKFVARYSEKLKANLGEGPYIALVLIVDCIVVLASIIEGNQNANGDYQAPLSTLTSPQINEFDAAMAKFHTSLGL